jgi:trk system potassium uptake protein TrkH
MNYRQIIKQLGILVLLVGACMSTSLIWAWLDCDQPGSPRVILSFLVSISICLALGVVFVYFARGDKRQLYRKEAIAVVGFGWILCGLLGALPFIFSGVLSGAAPGQYDNIWDITTASIFESVSGFTTTGASIFPAPQTLPRAILFWRSLTHWLGGMGIVVLFVAVLGQTGPGAKFLFSSEVPGPMAESLKPRIRSTALLLWKIYLGISVAEVLALLLQDMNLFESLCHTFGTMATGGFSTLNGSIGQYQHFGIEITIIIFMVLAGTNFNLHAALLQRKWKQVLTNREFQIYLLLLVLATGLLSVDLMISRPDDYYLGKALRSAGFQSVSIMTTTGYGTEDFNQWPSFSRWLLVMLMVIGGSAGSTGGGIKVIRIMLFVRVIIHEVEKTFRPNVVRPLRVGGQPVDEDFRRSVTTYVGMVLFIFFVATILLMVLHNEYHVEEHRHLDLETAFSAVAATLNNIGPGLNMVGATKNYAFFTGPAKILLSLLMILGRLEVMVILCLFVPNFYRRD